MACGLHRQKSLRNVRLHCSVSQQTHHNGGAQKIPVNTTQKCTTNIRPIRGKPNNLRRHADRPLECPGSVQSCKQQQQKKGRTIELVDKRCLTRNRKLYKNPNGKTRKGRKNTSGDTSARESGVADTRPVSSILVE